MSKNKKNRFNPQDTDAVENINDNLNNEYEENFDNNIDDDSDSQDVNIFENIESNDMVNEDTSVEQLQNDTQEDIVEDNIEYVEDETNTLVDDDTTIPVQTAEQNDMPEENDEQTESDPQDDLQTDENGEEPQNESNTIITDEQKSTNLVLYSVGTDFINGACINNLITTSNLDTAINECTRMRDKQKKSYYVFDNYGKCVFSCVYNIPKDNYYRVGTDWKNGTCINQKTACTDINEATLISNENTKSTGMVHRVYDPTGKVVFESKKKLTLFFYKKREVNKNADWYTK